MEPHPGHQQRQRPGESRWSGEICRSCKVSRKAGADSFARTARMRARRCSTAKLTAMNAWSRRQGKAVGERSMRRSNDGPTGGLESGRAAVPARLLPQMGRDEESRASNKLGRRRSKACCHGEPQRTGATQQAGATAQWEENAQAKQQQRRARQRQSWRKGQRQQTRATARHHRRQSRLPECEGVG